MMLSVRFGGRQERLRKTKIRDVGTYPGRCLSIGDEQSMVFGKDKDGPFYLSVKDQSRRKYDRLTGEVKVKEK